MAQGRLAAGDAAQAKSCGNNGLDPLLALLPPGTEAARPIPSRLAAVGLSCTFPFGSAPRTVPEQEVCRLCGVGGQENGETWL